MYINVVGPPHHIHVENVILLLHCVNCSMTDMTPNNGHYLSAGGINKSITVMFVHFISS